MKIREGFVTNSSSSSFVVYNLSNSDFCKYLYNKLREKNLTYNKYCAERPASSFLLEEDSLDANISCPYEGLKTDGYAPEVYGAEFNWHRLMDVKPSGKNRNGILVDMAEAIEDSEEVKKAYIATLKYSLNASTNSNYLLGEYISIIFKDYEISIDSEVPDYSVLVIPEGLQPELIKRMYEFMGHFWSDFGEHMIVHTTDNITYYEFRTRLNYKYSDVVIFYPDRILIGNHTGIKQCDVQADIRKMKEEFMSVLSDFVPLSEFSDADIGILTRLYRKDIRAGKFDCEVYLGTTD